MNRISADEYDFIGLFGKEPDRQGLDDIWLLDDSVYEACDGPLKLLFAVHPKNMDVRVILSMGDRYIYDYSAMDVQDVQILGGDLLVMISGAERMKVSVKPNIGIYHDTANT